MSLERFMFVMSESRLGPISYIQVDRKGVLLMNPDDGKSPKTEITRHVENLEP